VRGGDLGADLGDAGVDIRSGLAFSGNSDADGPKKSVRHFERRGPGNVEAIDEAIADEVEVGADRCARFAGEGTQARQHQRDPRRMRGPRGQQGRGRTPP
jgi:hypothetical protein